MEQEVQKKRLPAVPGMIHEATSPGDKSYIIGSKCRVCGTTFFPKRPACRVCQRDDTMGDVPLSTRGKINSFTLIYVAPVGFEAPYMQAYVDLPEKIRLYSIITGCELKDDALTLGQEVELVIDKLSVDEHGNDLIGYKFRPVK
jgi:uncharacterized OB-fold protein